MNEDGHEHGPWAYGHATVTREDSDGPGEPYPAKMCGCGKLLVASDGEEGTASWYQPSMFDWDGQLEKLEVTIHDFPGR